MTFGSAGVGTSQHLAGELFKSMAHVDIRHVPYRGAAPVITDLLGGRISMFFGNITAVLPQVQDGKLRALAVTSPKRVAATPDLPTLAEAGFPGFDATASFGLVAPAGTPPAIIDKLHRETVRILALPEVRKRFAELGSEVIGNSPSEFSAVIRADNPAMGEADQGGRDQGERLTDVGHGRLTIASAAHVHIEDRGLPGLGGGKRGLDSLLEFRQGVSTRSAVEAEMASQLLVIRVRRSSRRSAGLCWPTRHRDNDGHGP